MATGSNRVALGVFGSRIAGLVREIFIQATFGGGQIAADAFRVAMKIPNLIQNLLGEGSLSASFVPVYAKLVEDGEQDEAQRVASGVLGFMMALVTLLVAAMVLLARPLVAVFASGLNDEAFELAVTLSRITSVGVGFVTLSAFCLGVLNSHRRFLLAYSAPIVWNLAQILLLAGLLVTNSVKIDDPDSVSSGARWLAIAMVIGSLGQLLVLLPSTVRAVGGLRPHLDRSGGVNTVLRRAGPAVAGRGVVQLSSFVDLTMASWLAVGAINSVQSILVFYLLPISLFGFSVATAELTEMSRSSDKTDFVRARITIGLRKVALPAGLATAVLVAGSQGVVGSAYGLFGRGATTENIKLLGLVLAAYALGLPAAISARVTQNALYSVGDVAGPARIAFARLAVSVVIGTLVMFQLDRYQLVGVDIVRLDGVSGFGPLPIVLRDPEGGLAHLHLGAAGLGIGSASGAWVEWALLRARLNKTLDSKISSGLLLPITSAALLTAALLALFQRLVDLPHPFQGMAIGLIAMVTYIGSLRFQGYRPRGAV